MSPWIYINTAIEIINLCIITQLFETRIYFKNYIVPFIITPYDIWYWDWPLIDLAMESAGFTEGRAFVPTWWTTCSGPFVDMLSICCFISVRSSCLSWFKAASSYFLSINFSNVQILLEEFWKHFFPGLGVSESQWFLLLGCYYQGFLIISCYNMIRYYRLPYVIE